MQLTSLYSMSVLHLFLHLYAYIRHTATYSELICTCRSTCAAIAIYNTGRLVADSGTAVLYMSAFASLCTRQPTIITLHLLSMSTHPDPCTVRPPWLACVTTCALQSSAQLRSAHPIPSLCTFALPCMSNFSYNTALTTQLYYLLCLHSYI
jgi:hypothetical protein